MRIIDPNNPVLDMLYSIYAFGEFFWPSLVLFELLLVSYNGARKYHCFLWFVRKIVMPNKNLKTEIFIIFVFLSPSVISCSLANPGFPCCANLLYSNFFAKHGIKMKQIGSRGGHSSEQTDRICCSIVQ